MELPILPRGLIWSVYASSESCEKKGQWIADRKLLLGPRSLSVLVSAADKEQKG